jgi:alkylation response protein AidB-like acyl-CoA dehydrogenase
MIEELAALNGSAGWLAFPNSGQTFAAFNPDVARRIFAAEQRPTIGGSNGRNGTATRTDGGYLVSGIWPFASGCLHCSWLFATALVYDGDVERLNPDGTPLMQTFFFPQSQAVILDTWDSMGMRGTGSHDFRLDELFVPDELVADTIFDGYKHYASPIYQGHFVPLAMGSVALGLARAAIQSFIDIANAGGSGSERARQMKSKPFNQLALGEAEGAYRSARVWLHAAAAQAHDDALINGAIRPEYLTELKHVNVHAVQSSVWALDRIWQAVGPAGVYKGTVIERCFRDLHTSAQHIFALPTNLEAYGAEYFERPLHCY